MSRCIDMTVERDLAAPARARHALTVEFGDLPEALHADARLIVSELVTNAVLHGAGRVHVRMTLDGACLRVEVDDEAASWGRPSSESRGFQLVNALAQSFGVRSTAGGKTVWAEIAV